MSEVPPSEGHSAGGWSSRDHLTPPHHSTREDPWPEMQRQVEVMMNDLTVQMRRFREMPTTTVLAENRLLEAMTSCGEMVEDMRFALDTALEHPELYAMDTDELQARAERIRSWEREMVRAGQLGDTIRAAQRQRIPGLVHPSDAQQREGNDFLTHEHDVQRIITRSDDQTLDRLAGGVHRVRETATIIQDELETQEHVLDDVDTGMTRVQIRLEGAMRKVSKLLDSTSDRGKMICIGVLILILIVLIIFVVK